MCECCVDTADDEVQQDDQPAELADDEAATA